jgi:flavin reductase (DIM6/NTAB) family NADH-FMN oxidoreductase RutF
MTENLAQSMKLGMRRWASGVSVIAALGDDHQKYAMTASSMSSVSDAPVSLLVCIHQQARIHDVLTLGKAFSINVLGRHQEAISSLCASGDQGDRRFELGDWQCDANAPPFLRDAEAVFICELDQKIPFGTHSIVIGLIKEVHLVKSTPNPLVYLNGAYKSVGAE